MLARADEGHNDAELVRDAGERLLAHRIAQRGRPTFGDDADGAFAGLVASLSLADPATRAELQRIGDALGRHVYAKRFLDEPLPRALALLCEGLALSGGWRVDVLHAFHREATLASASPSPAVHALVSGALRGYLEECYNCEARVEALDDGRLHVALGRGRDVNEGARP